MTINVITSSEIMYEEIECMDILFYYSCVLIAFFIYCPQISAFSVNRHFCFTFIACTIYVDFRHCSF